MNGLGKIYSNPTHDTHNNTEYDEDLHKYFNLPLFSRLDTSNRHEVAKLAAGNLVNTKDKDRECFTLCDIIVKGDGL